jgi:hypothetical protein
MYPLILLFASLVLVLCAAVMLKPVPVAAGAVSILPPDRRVAYRVCAAAVVLSFLLMAGLLAAYSARPESFRWAISRPLDRLSMHYHWMIPVGVGLYAIARLCGVRHRRSLWLLCLSLPGAVTFPVTFVAAALAGVDRLDGVVIEFMIYPTTWILPIVAARQLFLLRKPQDTHLLSALAQTLLIVTVYLLMSFV